MSKLCGHFAQGSLDGCDRDSQLDANAKAD